MTLDLAQQGAWSDLAQLQDMAAPRLNHNKQERLKAKREEQMPAVAWTDKPQRRHAP